ncbi:MAG: hypothetical protein RL570_941, partial [Actinomycetota bacterium]
APTAPVVDPAKLTYTAPNEDGAAEAHGANEPREHNGQASPNQQQKPANGQGSSFFR